MSLFDPVLERTFQEDKKLLASTALPIVTISASFKEDLKKLHGYPDNNQYKDVVFSRAHYSMAVGLLETAWGNKVDAEKAWIVDPTNYVSKKQWRSIIFTEAVGKTIAKFSILKIVKDVIDKFGRQKLPILPSITPPLLYLSKDIKNPILSLHIAAGNILASQGKTVLQVITDPHVREEYAMHAHLPTMYYAVFDAQTKLELLEQAAIQKKELEPKRIFITGPPVDPKIVAARKTKKPWRSGILNLCITTGGLGTNKGEILDIFDQLAPELRRQDSKYRLLFYCSTQQDLYSELIKHAKDERIKVGAQDDESAKLRIIYHPQIVDANAALIQYGFPWADGIVTKPSGDMAYDAAAAGCFILTLKEWGEWEHAIREIFSQKNIARKLEIEHVVPQLEVLMNSQGKSASWIEQAMRNALTIDPLFTKGCERILETYHSIKS